MSEVEPEAPAGPEGMEDLHLQAADKAPQVPPAAKQAHLRPAAEDPPSPSSGSPEVPLCCRGTRQDPAPPTSPLRVQEEEQAGVRGQALQGDQC